MTQDNSSGRILRQTIPRPFTAVSGAAGSRPGIHAGFRGDGPRAGISLAGYVSLVHEAPGQDQEARQRA
ncbi:MAG: hypothetical protein ABR915_20305 [Thermoguttaceae bacterium]